MRQWQLSALAALPLVLSVLRPPAPPRLVYWTTHALEKIHPIDREPTNALRTVKIHAGRNEFEPFQIALRAEDGDIDDVDIEIADLRGQGGGISAEKYISVYSEGYLNLTIPSSVTGGTGEWPDPLIPRTDRYANERRNAFPFKLTRERTHAVWIDVYVPPSASPGVYTGEVHILSEGKKKATVPINLEVWNFRLPSTSSLVTTFGFSGPLAARGHYGGYTGDKQMEHLVSLYQKASLWHRISLDSSAAVAPKVNISNGTVQVRWDDYDAIVAPLMDGRVFTPDEPLYGAKGTSAALPTPKLLTTPEQQIQFWRQTARHFRDKGWFDRLFHYLWDEPKPNSFESMAELGRTVHRADPAVRNLVTAPLHTEWSDFIDIWTPAINCFERKPHYDDFCSPNVERRLYDAELAKGKQLWWYQACGSHGCFIVGGDYFRGWPSYMIDDAPVRNRMMEWLTWKYNIRGELYFNTDQAYAKKQDAWKDVRLFGGNGDGTLFYPGRPDIIGGSSHIPIESIRLKLIREGLEDYEYLAMLTKAAGQAPVAALVNTMVRTTYDYDQNPQKLYAVRDEIGRKLSELSSR